MGGCRVVGPELMSGSGQSARDLAKSQGQAGPNQYTAMQAKENTKYMARFVYIYGRLCANILQYTLIIAVYLYQNITICL